jgi:hypothetical protein
MIIRLNKYVSVFWHMHCNDIVYGVRITGERISFLGAPHKLEN